MQLSTYIQYFSIFQQTLKISFLMKIHQVHFIQGKKFEPLWWPYVRMCMNWQLLWYDLLRVDNDLRKTTRSNMTGSCCLAPLGEQTLHPIYGTSQRGDQFLIWIFFNGRPLASLVRQTLTGTDFRCARPSVFLPERHAYFARASRPGKRVCLRVSAFTRLNKIWAFCEEISCHCMF